MKKLFAVFFVGSLLLLTNVAHASPTEIKVLPPVAGTDKKVSPEQLIKLEKLDPKALAYTVQYVWVNAGHKFMIVHRVSRLNIKYKQDGGADVNADIGDAIIVNVPLTMPDMHQKGFTGFIKVDQNGDTSTYHPVTGKIVPYKD